MLRHHLAIIVNITILIQSFCQLLTQISVRKMELYFEISVVFGIDFYTIIVTLIYILLCVQGLFYSRDVSQRDVEKLLYEFVLGTVLV